MLEQTLPKEDLFGIIFTTPYTHKIGVLERFYTMVSRSKFSVVSVLGILAAFLVGCNMSLFERRSALDQWSLAVVGNDYAQAAALVLEEDAAVWLHTTQQLAQQHQGIASYQRSDIPTPPGQPPMTSTIWTFNDGVIRCLRVQQTADDHIKILDEADKECNH